MARGPPARERAQELRVREPVQAQELRVRVPVLAQGPRVGVPVLVQARALERVPVRVREPVPVLEQAAEHRHRTQSAHKPHSLWRSVLASCPQR